MPNKLSHFWHELKRRKVLHFLIAYITACFAIIEFFDITSERFTIPDRTFNLLYVLAGVGFPLVLILPWIVNRKKTEVIVDEPSDKEAAPKEESMPVKHNLPAQLTTFIGRENEMLTVKELIKEHRLVTLTGAGGCGKTRLAIEVAAQLFTDFEDGIWFVDLAPVFNEDRVAREISEALSIKEVSDKSLLDALIETIKDKKLMILLDNCEHLIRACAEVSGQLIQSASGVKILATSRESLGITGEQVWRVPSLSLLDPKVFIDVESARDSDAVMLFHDRARLNNPEFELEAGNVNEVVTICNKVDGIPLAVELVASRTRHMDPQMILERFADQFENVTSSDPRASKRQQTLHSTIEWSYNLLSDSEKLLFTRLSVFSGGFNIEAAEEVCSDDRLPREIVLDTLSKLVDRSLVYTMKAADQSMRYKCLETLRQFGHQVIKEKSSEELLRKRHLQFFLALAEQAYKEQFDLASKWMIKLELEHDNLIVALDWSFNQSVEEFVLLSGYMAWFWRDLSKLRLAVDYLEKALSRDSGKSEAYGRTLFGLGINLFYTGEIPRAIKLLDESLKFWRKFKNLWEEAVVLGSFGTVIATTDQETALRYREQSLEVARKVGDPGLVRYCLLFVCQQYAHTQQYDRGMPLVEELYDTSVKHEYPLGIYASMHFRSDLILSTKKYKEAEKQYAHALESGLGYGFILYAVMDMQGVAFALSGQSRWAKTIRLDTAAREKMKAMGLKMDGLYKFWDEWVETYLRGARKEVGEELTRQYEQEGIAMGFEKAVEYAMDLEKD